MPDPIARKRLKKKMIDRWENEGGRVAADPTSTDEKSSSSQSKGKGKQLSAAREATVEASSLKKKRKPGGK